MKENRPILLSRLLHRYIALPLAVLWLLFMTVLTWAVGRDFYCQLEEAAGRWQDRHWQSVTYDLPGQASYELLQELGLSFHYLHTSPLLPIVLPQTPDSYGSDDWLWEKWDLLFGLQAAFGFYDHQGNPLFQTGGQYLYFAYSTTPADHVTGYAYIDVSALENGQQLADTISTHPGGGFSLMWMEMVCKGRLEGDRFYPTRMVSENGVVYYESEQTDENQVTLYLHDRAHGYNSDPGPGFLWKGKYYDSPAQLLNSDATLHYNFFSSLIVANSSNPDYLSSAVIHCSPALYATQRLLPVYLLSGLALIICIALLRKRLRQYLCEPLDVINRSYEQNRTELSSFADSPIWELQLLADFFKEAQQDRHQANTDAQQLRTALTYAENAEASRRKMVSAIAHELKTPLAVIHSYAEGLQAGIAGDKQDQYLSVILEETEHMDEMVLEMLDLSRLEAGKVRLSTEQFSLSRLTASIYEKLQLAAQVKQLEIQLLAKEDVNVTADKGRLSQAITNLMTNAIKYSPVGGNVTIRVCRRGLHAIFSIENPCEPLSREALEQVWDSFYRTDEARDRTGTGLGLAITKSIIELHRGQCQVQNTPTGVEFSFRIPL